MSRALCATAVLALTVAGCGAVRGDDGLTGKTIRYEVDYSGTSPNPIANRAVSIRYSGHDGESEERIVALPWTGVVDAAPAGFTPSVTAQLYGFGTIVCRILAGDTVIANRSSAEEPYSVVRCAT